MNTQDIKPFADLSGADLYGADLRGADLHEADLHEADLHEANLYGADLYGADLHGANLHGANLRGADLYGAYLYGADLRGADLYEAYLYGAYLRGADLYEAKGILSITSIGSRDDTLFIYIKEKKLMFKAGCFDGDEFKFRKAVQETHGFNQYRTEYIGAIILAHRWIKRFKE